MSTENVYVFLESSNHTEDLIKVVITSVHYHSSVSFAKQLALIDWAQNCGKSATSSSTLCKSNRLDLERRTSQIHAKQHWPCISACCPIMNLSRSDMGHVKNRRNLSQTTLRLIAYIITALVYSTPYGTRSFLQNRGKRLLTTASYNAVGEDYENHVHRLTI